MGSYGRNLGNTYSRTRGSTVWDTAYRQAGRHPKADGRQKAAGPCRLEDRLPTAVVEVLNAIYEVDFLGFSYGFVCPEQEGSLM